MKVTELFEARSEMSIMTMIDREIYGKKKKPGLDLRTLHADPDQVNDPVFAKKAKNAYSRGFRGAFSGYGGESTGIGNDVMKDFERGMADGGAERKKALKAKTEIPAPHIVKNRYGEKKPNQDFERMVKAVMAPYLEPKP